MHRRAWIVVCLIVLSLMAAQAQAPSSARDIKLVGDRFKPLKWDEMTSAQKTMMEHLFAGERRGAGGPFNVLLRSPEMGDRKSTRLNSSHLGISYAVFWLKKK